MTTMREPEWDDDTRALVLGLAGYEDSLCPLCKRPAHICQDSARQFDWITPPPTRCHATTASMAQQAKFKEETNPQVGALLFEVALREDRRGHR